MQLWERTLLYSALVLLGIDLGGTNGQTVTFRKVADSNTPIPGGVGTFSSFLVETSLDAGTMVFQAGGSPSGSGIYAGNGGTLTTIADAYTAIPGGTGNFTDFVSVPSIDGGNVAFTGKGTYPHQGVYTHIGGVLNLVADTNTPAPGGTGSFSGFGGAYLDGTDVAFRRIGGTGERGVYTHIGGMLGVVADNNTEIPNGTGNFLDFGGALLDASQLIFVGLGTSGQKGLYVDLGGSVGVIADANTPIPGGSGNFTSIAAPSLDGGTIAFVGSGSSGQNGVYRYSGGTLSLVVDATAAIPGGTENFAGFNSVSLDSGRIVFNGFDSEGSNGIYADFGLGSFKIVDRNSTIDGKTPDELAAFTSRESLSGDEVGFFTGFTDGSSGYFIATVPLTPFCGDGICNTPGEDACNCGEDCLGDDADGDRVCDTLDNCPQVANPSQLDTDNDGVGDACDTTVPTYALGEMHLESGAGDLR